MKKKDSHDKCRNFIKKFVHKKNESFFGLSSQVLLVNSVGKNNMAKVFRGNLFLYWQNGTFTEINMINDA